MKLIAKIFFTSFCILLLICSISQAQVKIKERIEITPSQVNLEKGNNNVTLSSHTVRFEIDWDKSSRDGFIRVIYPYDLDHIMTNWTSGGSLSLTVNNFIAPGIIRFQFKVNLYAYEPTNVNYRMYIDEVLVRSGTSTLTGSWNSIPYRNVEYSFDGELYKLEILEPVSNSNEIINTVSEIPTTIVKARLKDYNRGNVDFNFELEVEWLKTDVDPNETVTEYLEGNVTVQNASIAEWTIPWDEKFKGGYSKSTKLIVTAVADGDTYTKELLNTYKILADEEFNKYIIHTSPSGTIPIYGDEPEDLFARTYKGISGSGVPFEYLPAETKYNLEITEGQEHGVLGYKANGNTVSDTGKALNNLDHYYGSGRLYFEYKPYKEVQSKENVTIKVSTTDPAIEPVDMKLVLSPNPFLAKAEPNVIQPGDTCKIILQVYDESTGGYIDFAEDHEFYVDLWDGWWYGDLYSYYEDDLDYWWWDIPGPFDFIAFEDVFTGEDADKDEVTVLVYVETYIVYDDEGNPLPNKVVSGDKIMSMPDKLPRKEMAKLRKQPRETRKKEILLKKKKSHGKGVVLYEKDNLKISHLAASVDPIKLTSSVTVETFFEITIKKELDEAVEILLGETKYFGVQKKVTPEKTEYKIAEIPTNYGNEPDTSSVTKEDGWKWEKSDVWGTSPIEVISEKDGAKSGVYWEKKWFKGSDNSNQPLNEGMIRLIGRYWEEGKEEDYKVKLKAKIGNETIDDKIKVIKPDKLGDKYDKARDVFNKEYSVDSLCIKIGGEIGVPPHMIKGHIYTESASKSFTFDDGTSDDGFAPSYRYEPYTTQFDLSVIPKNNPYIVSETGMGTPKVPTKTEHQNLEHGEFFHYFESAKSVWDVIEEKSRIVDINNTYTTYGFQYEGTGKDKLKKGQVKSGVYSIVDDSYQDYLKGKKDKNGNRTGGYEAEIRAKYNLKLTDNLSVDQQTEANNLARNSLIKFLKTEWKGDLDKIPAQTRIAASYGLLQMLYRTAYDEHGYREMPEKLNEVSVTLDYCVKHLKKLFNNNNGFPLDEKNANWESEYSGRTKKPKFSKPNAGYEEALKVMFWMWNSKLTVDKVNAYYHTKVFTNSEEFLPGSE